MAHSNHHHLEKEQGSPEEFEEQWAEALSHDGGRWLIYPEGEPRTQWDLFEKVKMRQIQAILEAQGLSAGRMLEVGCGAAGVSICLANKGFDGFAMDLSENALKLAMLNDRRHRQPGAAGGLQFMVGDAFHLPFESEVFDGVMSYGLLEHFAMESLDEALTESLRVLKPGGLFLADVIHSRFSVRTLGITASFMGSLLYHIITRQISKVCTLYPAYFQEHYENDLNHQDYNDLLRRRGMEDVRVQVCRPFPPLALSGWADGRYTQLMMKLGGLWNWFDSSDSPISRRLGWMYLISARKPA